MIVGAREEGLTEIVPLGELNARESTVIFGRGAFGGYFAMHPQGAVDLVWGQQDREEVGADRTRVASSLHGLFARLTLVAPDADFDGHPAVTDLLGDRPSQQERIALPARITASSAGPARNLGGPAKAYLNALPGWLRDVLDQCNGGHVQGIDIGVPTPAGVRQVEAVSQLFCVAAGPHHPAVESSSLHAALVAQGLDERLFPFAITELNATLLTDSNGQVYVWPDEAEFDAIEKIGRGDELIVALQKAARAA